MSRAAGEVRVRHRWGIRSKLVAVVLLPTLAALLLGGLRTWSSLQTSASYSRLQSFAQALPQVQTLLDDLETERDLTAGVVAGEEAGRARLATARTRTDAAVVSLRLALVGVDTSGSPTVRDGITSVTDQLDGLPRVRSQVDNNAIAADVQADYTNAIAGVVSVVSEVGQQADDNDVRRYATELNSIVAMKEAVSQQRYLLSAALLSQDLTPSAYADFVSAVAAQRIALAGFTASASAADLGAYRQATAGPAAQQVTAAVQQTVNARAIGDVTVPAAAWSAASTSVIDRLGTVQTAVSAELVATVSSLNSAARTNALLSAGLVYLVLALALGATLLLARSILRPLRTLRSAALQVAYDRLPETVRRMEESDDPTAELDVSPVGLAADDEIGQVARAFDAVHAEAVRMAGEQAVMRGNVSRMFVNLSRRSQALVERQLRLIDELEAGEQDADQLANLFRLDHLATRMRRNDESLLVLAGAEAGRRRTTPVALIDVLRAATGEVEQYERVKLEAEPGYRIAGPAANDVIHLLAELLDNATSFSPPHRPVWLRALTLESDGALLVEIEDSGVGMTADDLAAANAKLSGSTGMDVAMSRLMGLFVVARLARRHDVTVDLQANRRGGVLAFVRLPAAIVIAPDAHPAPEPAVAVSVGAANGDGSVSSPIFDALRSEWFTRRSPLPALDRPASAAVEDWTSPADAGWRAASRLGADAVLETTPAGLPKRIPGGHLVPGRAAEPAPAAGDEAPSARPPRQLSGFQQGVRRARDLAASGGAPEQDARGDEGNDGS